METEQLSPKPASGETAEEPEYTLREFAGDAMDIIECVAAAVFIVILTFTFLLCVARVEGTSMVPTLEDGDRLAVSRLSDTYQNGDILIINNWTGHPIDSDGNIVSMPGFEKRIVKRLIAQPGQTVDIDFDAGIVYVDGEALDEPYTNTPTNSRVDSALPLPLTVPEGYVFVLGDNRNGSSDSRSCLVGLVEKKDILGKVLFRILPLSKIGKIPVSGAQNH